MDPVTLRKVQLSMLEIAKEIKRVCDENGINYFLDSGTLLGAVRHKGFIPWDDDMDIGMLRSDYEKFLKIAPSKLDKQYFLQTWDSDPGYSNAFAKVRKLGTVYVEETSQYSNQKHRELYVDIFPYDVYPDNEYSRRKTGHKIMLLRNAIWIKCGVKAWLHHTVTWKRIASHMSHFPEEIYAATHSLDSMKSEYTHYMELYNGESSQYYVPGAGIYKYGKWIIPSHCLENYQNILFENVSFSAPLDYDTYLKHAYGDYMKLPPKNERGNRHKIIELKL